jgi:hypothetical protein
MGGCCCNIVLRQRGWFVVAVALSLAGCGDKSNRLPMAGTVTWQGRPLAKGSIVFVPTAEHRGPKVGAPIVNGEYEIERDRGATPGTYRVEVRADAGEYPHSPSDKPRPKVPAPQMIIPPEYNRQSKLTVIVSREKARFDFKLPLLPQ